MKIEINENQLKLLIEHIINERYDNKRARSKRGGKKNPTHNKGDSKEDAFWGKKGAGALILCPETKRFLLPLRSKLVDNGGTWGTWGGAIDSGESPIEAVAREVQEETKYSGEITFYPLYEYQHENGFVYYNFLGVTQKEFKPIINWETERVQWVNLNEFPINLHFGLQSILANNNAMQIINKFIDKN